MPCFLSGTLSSEWAYMWWYCFGDEQHGDTASYRGTGHVLYSTNRRRWQQRISDWLKWKRGGISWFHVGFHHTSAAPALPYWRASRNFGCSGLASSCQPVGSVRSCPGQRRWRVRQIWLPLYRQERTGANGDCTPGCQRKTETLLMTGVVCLMRVPSVICFFPCLCVAFLCCQSIIYSFGVTFWSFQFICLYIVCNSHVLNIFFKFCYIVNFWSSFSPSFSVVVGTLTTI